jgi:hypothetical protein
MLFTLALSLTLAGANAKASIEVPKISNGSNVNDTVTLRFTSPPMTTSGDNAAILNPWLDSLPEGVLVETPRGEWPVFTALTVTKQMTVRAPKNTTSLFRLIASGVSDDACRVGGNQYVDGVVFQRLVFDVAGNTKTGIYNCLDVTGGAFYAEDCGFSNCPHEGVVGGGGYPGDETEERPDLGAVFVRCWAYHCGFGNDSYGLSTAGLNGHWSATIYDGCWTDWCCQACEIDGHHSRIINCHFRNPSFETTPVIGINIGSTGKGIFDVQVTGTTVEDYPDAIGSGNGIGCLANVWVYNNTVVNGFIGIMGGIDHNLVFTDPAAPDTGQSHVDGNVMILTNPHTGGFGYGAGPGAGEGDIYGREPCTFNNNIVYYLSDEPRFGLVFGVGGKTVGRIEFFGNVIYDMDEPPVLLDLRLQSNNDNLMVSPPPNVFYGENRAFRRDGSERPFTVYVEPPR